MAGPDSPDFQLTINITAVPTDDNPDWQVTAVGPGGVPISSSCEITGPGGTISVCVADVMSLLPPVGSCVIHIGSVGVTETVWTQEVGAWHFVTPGDASDINCEFAQGSSGWVVGNVFTIQSNSGTTSVAGWSPPSGGSGGYDSLTGAGETATPGDLTQAGGFTVNAADATGINLNSSAASIQLVNSDSGNSGVNIENSNATNTGGIGIGDMGTNGVYIQYNGSGKLGFYGAPPVVQPATPVTLADVIAALQALGLTN